MKKNILTIIDLLIIVMVVVYISLMAGFWSGYPIGTDAYTHLFKVKFLLENWPNVDWNNLWSAGMPMFLWYSIIPYLALVGVKLVTGSYELSMQICSLAAMLGIIWAIYLTVKTVTNNRLAAFLSAILATISPALWSKMAMGEIPRLMGTAWMPIAWWVVIVYLLEKNKKRSWQLLILIIVALALCTHYVMTAFVVLTLGIIIYFAKKNMDEVWNSWQKWIIHPVVLAIFSLLPFFISSGLKQVFGEGLFGGNAEHPTIKLVKFLYEPAQLTNVFNWASHDYGSALYPIILPLAIVVLILAISHRQKQQEANTEWRILKAFFYINVFFIIYATANYFGFPGKFYNAAIPPTDAFYYLSMTLPVLVGLCWPLAIRNKYLQTLAAVLVLAIGGYCANLYFPYRSIQIKNNDNYHYFAPDKTLKDDLNKLLGDQPENFYRFAHNNSFLAVWFNYDFSQIPQTRDYFSQALLNNNAKFWFENAVFALKDNYQETKYLLDWWGVKWLSVGAPNLNFEKFIKRPEWFEPKTSYKEDEFYHVETYQYQEAKPIYHVTNAKTLLVVSDPGTYNNVLLAMSQIDLGSDKLIPIQGKQMIDLYTLEELQQFDGILIHNFNYMEKERAFDLLDKYVQSGGKLMVESSAVLSAEGGEIAFPPVPVKKLMPGNFGMEWNLKKENEDMLQGVELDEFGPAVYGKNQPWSMLYADKAELRDGAEAILSNNDKVVIAKISLGKGEVIWSGLNIFYHLNNYKKTSEAKLIENMMVELLDFNNFQPKSTLGQIINPQLRQAKIDNPDYTGFLVKENYYSTWTANYDLGGLKKKLTVWQAGPGMMYIRLPKFEKAYTVNLSYHKWWFEWLSYGLSLVYLLWLIYTHLINTEEQPEAAKMEKVKKSLEQDNPKLPSLSGGRQMTNDKKREEENNSRKSVKSIKSKGKKKIIPSTKSVVPSQKGKRKSQKSIKSVKSKVIKSSVVKKSKPKKKK